MTPEQRAEIEARHREVPTLDPTVTRCTHDYDFPLGFEDDLWPCDTEQMRAALAEAEQERDAARADADRLAEALAADYETLLSACRVGVRSRCHVHGAIWPIAADRCNGWIALAVAVLAAIGEGKRPAWTEPQSVPPVKGGRA